ASPTVVLPAATGEVLPPGRGTSSDPRAPAGGPATRLVRFNIKPGGAHLFIDGVERIWFGAYIELSVGTHNVEARPEATVCCKTTTGPVTVLPPPADKPRDLQGVWFSLDLNPASVNLAANAPRGAQVHCRGLGLTVLAGRTAVVALHALDWTGTCELS